MEEVTEILAYLQERLDACYEAPDSPYRDGSIAELEEAIEFIQELL